MKNTADIKLKLERGDFDGLYVSGTCACLKEDLAPCGSSDPDDQGWINRCAPGYRHNDPRAGHEGEWAISGSKTRMTGDDFAAINI